MTLAPCKALAYTEIMTDTAQSLTQTDPLTDALVTDTPTLQAWCHTYAQQPWITVDTEFLRVDTYYPKLCLVQLSDPTGRAICIDPLRVDDLSPLWQLLEQPDLCKVFHSARQDLEVLALQPCLPTPIFDTQIAGVFFGLGDQMGLANMAKTLTHWQLKKDQTRTDWSQRPLHPDQIQYALADVKSLACVYDHILQQLTPKQTAALAQDAQRLAQQTRPDAPEQTPSHAGWRIKGIQKLAPKNQAIALKLAQWRETHAQTRNLPRRWVLSDEAILAMAKRPPSHFKALYKVPNLKPRHLQAFGDTWIELIDAVFAAPQDWPPKPTPSPAMTQAQNVAWQLGLAWRDQITHTHGLLNPHWLHKSDLKQILIHPNPHEAQLWGWRHLLFEQPFKGFLNQAGQFAWQQNQLVYCPT